METKIERIKREQREKSKKSSHSGTMPSMDDDHKAELERKRQAIEDKYKRKYEALAKMRKKN